MKRIASTLLIIGSLGAVPLTTASAQDLPTGLGGAPTAASGARCLSPVAQSGTSAALLLDARYQRAQRRAERNWRNYVAATYGSRYAELAKATSKRMTCVGVPGRALAINCTITAFPCRY